MATGKPQRIFTVPPGRPFLTALAEAILAGALPDRSSPPDVLALSRYTVLLPTRRATRALQEAFLKASGGAALLLPKVRAIAEGQEDLGLLTDFVSASVLGHEPGEIPPAVPEVERRLVLTRLVLAWSESMRSAGGDGTLAVIAGAGARSPAQASNLAAELARLADAVETEGVSLDGLAGLVPEHFAAHWGQTLEFLKIVTQFWPVHLAERGFLAPADRRNRILLAEADRLAAHPPDGPVIVAGVTGSIPATARLMSVVAGLDRGCLVLPGLDQTLDDESWQAIVPEHPEHPQFGLRKLLDALGVVRADVAELPGEPPPASRRARQRLISEAMRPAATAELWHQFPSRMSKAAVADALDGVSYLEAASAQEEAEAVALILREAVEHPGRTAALVSPDRLLARRVAARLETWGLRVDDSAGRPFAKTVPGAFLDLVVDAAAQNMSPAPLMALLKHPLCRMGLPVADVRRGARALELAVFRRPYLGVGLDGIDVAVEEAAADRTHAHRAVRRLWDADWDRIRMLVRLLRTCCGSLSDLFEADTPVTLRAMAAAHMAAAEALARPSAEGATSLWDGEAGEAGAVFFSGLMDEALPTLEIRAGEYPDLYRSLLVGQNVRPRVPVHPRLHIWGPFEARLQQPDVVVLGSLNEGTWPEATDPGPWLNRPMRQALGLPSPEEKIGHGAHDVSTLLGAERVILTRAGKIDGVPTVPSRWLMRLQAVLGGLGLADGLRSDQPWLDWARARDNHGPPRRARAPEPRPPVALRPRRLSVTGVETWIANPYGIFARHVLGLDPLDPLDKEPDAALKGGIIHGALGRFANLHSQALPADVAGELVRLAREALGPHVAHPRVAAFWLPRFERFAEWFAETEPRRRSGVKRVLAELSGALVLDAPAGPFTLTARADRIDVREGGALAVVDYKTGTTPTPSRVLGGEAPQLPLEAAIAGGGGFDHVDAARVAALSYIRVTGAEPPGEERPIACDDPAAIARAAVEGLTSLIADFDREETPYRATRRHAFKDIYRFDSYAHLARAAEWAGAAIEET